MVQNGPKWPNMAKKGQKKIGKKMSKNIFLRSAAWGRRPFKYFDPDWNFAVATRPGPFRATFALPAKSATAKNTNFALDGYNRFMKPSWARDHGKIFGKVYIVWVCGPRYKPLSCQRSRVRENSVSKFGPNFVIHSGGIFNPVVLLNSVHSVVELLG